MEQFKNHLQQNGLRCTAERVDIAKAVLSFNDMFSADELWGRIKELGWPVSKATLYRSIPILIEAGMIKPIDHNQLNNHIFKRCIDNDLVRSINCKKCDNQIIIKEELVKKLKKILLEKYDIEEVLKHLLMLKGICPSCMKQIESLVTIKTTPSPFSKNRIILFEDDDMVSSLLKHSLEEDGHEVFVYNNPTEFHLDCLCNSDKRIACADLFLVDIKMPKMSGMDFIKRQIRKDCRIRKIAFISAYWTVEHIKYAESIGATIFYKPFDIHDLRKWMKSAIPKARKECALGNEFLTKPLK